MRIVLSRAPLRVFALAIAAELVIAGAGLAWLATRPWPGASP